MAEQTQSDSIEEIAKAMVIVQQTPIKAKKGSEATYIHSKYADLESVWDAVREPLTTNGLAVLQTNELCENGVIIITTLMHTSGQWIRGKLQIIADKPTPQGYGSAITYGRRYALMAMVGVSPVDDDGEEAMGRQKQKKPDEQATKSGAAPMPNGKAHTFIEYTLPDETSEALTHIKTYKPKVVVEEDHRYKVGKFMVEISADNNMVWSDVPRFNERGYDMAKCVPCAVAYLMKTKGKAYVQKTYGLEVN